MVDAPDEKPYVKKEIRKQVVKMLQKGYTYCAAADAFDIDSATVNHIWRVTRQIGNTTLRLRGGGTRPAITAEQENEFERFVAASPLVSYDDLTAAWSKIVHKKSLV